MKARIVFICIALMAISAFAQTKPSLENFQVLGVGKCPDDSPNPCFLITNGTTLYVVKGEGYGKEETIWLVNNDKLSVVWSKPKELI